MHSKASWTRRELGCASVSSQTRSRWEDASRTQKNLIWQHHHNHYVQQFAGEISPERILLNVASKFRIYRKRNLVSVISSGAWRTARLCVSHFGTHVGLDLPKLMLGVNGILAYQVISQPGLLTVSAEEKALLGHSSTVLFQALLSKKCRKVPPLSLQSPDHQHRHRNLHCRYLHLIRFTSKFCNPDATPFSRQIPSDLIIWAVKGKEQGEASQEENVPVVSISIRPNRTDARKSLSPTEDWGKHPEQISEVLQVRQSPSWVFVSVLVFSLKQTMDIIHHLIYSGQKYQSMKWCKHWDTQQVKHMQLWN